MAQVLICRQEQGRDDWIPYVMIPSLDRRSLTPGAIMWIANAENVVTRKPVAIKAVGTGEEDPRRMRYANVG